MCQRCAEAIKRVEDCDTGLCNESCIVVIDGATLHIVGCPKHQQMLMDRLKKKGAK